MRAEEFGYEFLKKFDEEFSKVNYDYMEDELEIVNFKNFTICISNIMKLIAKNNNLKLRKEFLNLDYVFFEQKSNPKSSTSL